MPPHDPDFLSPTGERLGPRLGRYQSEHFAGYQITPFVAESTICWHIVKASFEGGDHEPETIADADDLVQARHVAAGLACLDAVRELLAGPLGAKETVSIDRSLELIRVMRAAARFSDAGPVESAP